MVCHFGFFPSRLMMPRMGQFREKFRRWNRRRAEGHAAIEFALIAPVFFMLLMAIIETGMVYFAESALENGVEIAARMIRTGQVQAGNMTQTQFRQVVCDNVNVLLSCDSSKLQLDVRAFSGFGGASYPSALDSGGHLKSDLNAYNPGGSCQVVLVRAFYKWTLFTPIFAAYFSNMAGDDRLLTSAVAFRNEPYGATPC